MGTVVAAGLAEKYWLEVKDPHQTHKRSWRGHDVLVEIWIEETDLPWDGEEPLDEGSTGWDATVRVSFDDGKDVFTAGDRCGGIWISGTNPWKDDCVVSCLSEYEEEALILLGSAAAQGGHVCPDPDCLVQGVMER